jgi:histidinol-phosphate aminotransferase
LPKDVLLVIDAAYAEFVSRNDYDPGIRLVEKADNVVMTRTFSKIYALGGLRLGWAYCSEEVAGVLNRVRGPFNVSSPALAAGEAALLDQDWTDKSRAHNEAWRDWTAEKVAELGFETTDSVGNFVLIRFPGRHGGDAEAADAYLRADGIIVRRMAAYGLPDWLRVSIGAEDEMRAFVGSLGAFAAGTRS